MFEGMGIDWASTLLGLVAAALVPIPVWFLFYGHKLREKSKFAPTMKVKPQPEEEQRTEEEPSVQPAGGPQAEVGLADGNVEKKESGNAQ